MIKYRLIVVLLCLHVVTLPAQEALKPRPSPLAIISMRFKDAYVKVTYSQPHKRGREIFGTLVPYNKVWRTGANEATEITLTRDIQIKDNLLKAGTYSVFTIPEKEKWTIIINGDVGMWGAYNYNPKMDVLKIEVPVQQTETVYEPFTMVLDQRNEVADWSMMWDRTKVQIPIKFIN